ncbi:MAG: NAD(P)H-hydrate epimerase [Nitrososphaerales archaeon]
METITPDEMRILEERAENLGIPRLLLMENAGSSIARILRTRFPNLKEKKIVVLAGSGNNGGDGFVAARHLVRYCDKVYVILLSEEEKVRTLEAQTNLKIIKNMNSLTFIVCEKRDKLEENKELILKADIILDAIFGTGIKGSIKEPYSSTIELINNSKAFKVAVDIPSGLDPLDGKVHDKAVKADLTVSFHRAKKGLLLRKDLVGELIVEDIGIPPDVE